MKPQKSYIKILSVLGIFAAGLFVVFYFVYQDIKTRAEHTSALTQDLDFQSSHQEYLLTTQRMLENIKSDVDKVNSSVVSSDGDVQFIESLEAVAKNQGLSIDIKSLVIEDSPALTSGGMTNLKVKAETKGSWAGTYTFLAQLESLPFKIKINNFSIKSEVVDAVDGGKPSTVGWTGSFEIRVLKYK